MKFNRTNMQIKRSRNLALQHRNFSVSQTYYIASKMITCADRVNYHDKVLADMTDVVNKNTTTLKGITAAIIDHIGSIDSHGI